MGGTLRINSVPLRLRASWVLIAAAIVAAVAPALADPTAFTPCPDFEADARAVCGTISVREDRSKAGGRKIDLRVVLLKAASPGEKAPLFMLAGGPGQAATDLAAIALGPYAAVRETRDVVLVDQRGTGGSNRLDCSNGSDKDPRKAFGTLWDPVEIAACRGAAAAHADVRLYATEQVVADLEDVRATLGYDRVILWGGSGGTRTAQAWLRAAPARIEAVVLDGVVAMDMRAPSTYARSSQDALERVFADCDAQAACKVAYPDLRTDFSNLLGLFDKGPVLATVTTREKARVTVNMHRGDFAYAVRGILYNARGIVRFPGMIHAAAKTGDLSAFAQAHWERDAVVRTTLAVGVHLAVFCTEDVPFIDRAAVTQLTRDTFIGSYLIDQYTHACEAWDGRGARPAGFEDHVRGTAPVLLVSGYYDPSTPPSMAESVAKGFANSRHIVVRNQAHGAGFGCARAAVEKFLVTASLEGVGPVCEEAGPIDFAIK